MTQVDTSDLGGAAEQADRTGAPTSADDPRFLLRTITSTIAQGILVHDGYKVIAANPRLIELLDCPAGLAEPGRDIQDFIDFGLARGDYEGATPLAVKAMRKKIRRRENYITERATPTGRILRIDARNRAGMLSVVTYTDVTDARQREDELRESRAKVRHLAENDGLTALTNRRAFDADLADRLSRDADADARLAIILVDLDRFKPVNDRHGHGVGDALLRTLAARFRAAVRQSDTVARIGGDEFAVLAETSCEREVRALAKRLHEAAAGAVRLDGVDVSVGASIGYVLVDGPTDDPDHFMRAADLALYAAKRNGRDRVVAFADEMAQEADARASLEADLKHALARGEMTLAYQPQIDLATGRITGCEALMRWRHPTRGAISPGTFIPIAEDTGEIVALGRWALRQACDDAKAMASTLGAPLRIAVNASPIQFARSDIIADVDAAIETSGLDPSLLEIEVTERLLIDRDEETREALEGLRARDVSVALDDFGTGYSSLRYLTAFPFSKIKIDRGFIDKLLADDRTGALVNSILTLAKALDLKVTAEGVETEAQLDALRGNACDEAQGYLIGHPMDRETLLDFLGEARSVDRRVAEGRAA